MNDHAYWAGIDELRRQLDEARYQIERAVAILNTPGLGELQLRTVSEGVARQLEAYLRSVNNYVRHERP